MTLHTFANSIVALEYSPDGRYLATVHKFVWSRDLPHGPSFLPSVPSVRLWRAGFPSDDSELAAFELDDGCLLARFTPEGKLVTNSKSGLFFWDLEARESQKLQTAPVDAISPDGRLAASRRSDEAVVVFEVESGMPKRDLPPDCGLPLAFSPDGRLLATAVWSDQATDFKTPAQDDFQIAIWNLDTGEEQARFTAGAIYSYSQYAFSLSGSLFATRSRKERIVGIWNTSTGDLVAELGEHAGPIWGVAFSPDGCLLASSGECEAGGQIKLWDVQTGAELRTMVDGSTWGITALTFSPDSERLASGDAHGNVKLWEVSSPSPLE